MDASIRLIVGLGNPDPKYANTYHNAGFLFTKYLASKIAEMPAGVSAFEILQSDVYMNESGRFVAKVLKKHNIKPENLLVVHDDSDLTLENYKLTFGQSAAGHHGIESVQTALKTQNFWRLRIGIRPPKETVRQKAEKFVLKKISPADRKILKEVFAKATLQIQS